MTKERIAKEEEFKKDIMEVYNRDYGIKGKWSMNKKWKNKVLRDIWAKNEGSLLHV